jgi:hypothetical protein
MKTYEFESWDDYVRAKAEEMKRDNPDLGPEFIAPACIEKRLWEQNKKHYESVKACLASKEGSIV